MPLEMELSNLAGDCDKCGEYEWLYKREKHYYCSYCLQAMELAKEDGQIPMVEGK